MKKIRRFTKSAAFFLAAIIFVSSCTSTTMIRSNPKGAKVYLDGVYVGKTPYRMTDTKIVGTCTRVELELGSERLDESICRNEEADVGAIIGGVLLLVPFLWTMRYQPEHTYDFGRIDDDPEYFEPEPTQEEYRMERRALPKPDRSATEPVNDDFNSKTDKLWKLKQLLDSNVITKEEFEKEKKKILGDKN